MIFETTDGYQDEDRRYLFVMAANTVFSFLRLSVEYPIYRIKSSDEGICKCLSSMIAAAEYSLKRGLSDCGTYVELPWLMSILEFGQAHDRFAWSLWEQSHPLTDRPSPKAQASFLRLLAVLQQSIRTGLISGKRVQETFDEGRVGKPVEIVDAARRPGRAFGAPR